MSRTRRWLFPVLFGIAVLSMSGPWGSTYVTEPAVENGLRGTGLSIDTLDLVNQVARKAGHIAAYALFGWLVFRALRGRRAALLAFVAGVALACADESLQLLSPDRGASVQDVLVDAVGTAAGVAAAAMWARRRARASAAGAPASASPGTVQVADPKRLARETSTGR